MSKIMIYDSHCHVVPHGFNASRNSLYLDQLLSLMRKSSVKKALVTLNPFICERMCLKNHYVYYTYIADKHCGKIVCQTCGKNIYSNEHDPYRHINVALIEESQKYKDIIYPLVYLTTNKYTFQEEIDYFEKYYFDAFYGFKFISTFNASTVKELHKIRTRKPLLFHTKNDEYAKPCDIISVTDHLSVPIILAHFCSFDKNALDVVSSRNNYFTDISPLLDLKSNYENKDINKIFPIWNEYESISFEKMFESILHTVDYKKILFGTDAPWGNMQDEIRYFNSLNFSRNISEKIYSDNLSAIISFCSY